MFINELLPKTMTMWCVRLNMDLSGVVVRDLAELVRVSSQLITWSTHSYALMMYNHGIINFKVLYGFYSSVWRVHYVTRPLFCSLYDLSLYVVLLSISASFVLSLNVSWPLFCYQYIRVWAYCAYCRPNFSLLSRQLYGDVVTLFKYIYGLRIPEWIIISMVNYSIVMSSILM